MMVVKIMTVMRMRMAGVRVLEKTIMEMMILVRMVRMVMMR